MAFDPRDIYDAAALYDMWLNCHACPASFDFEPNRPIGLDYYHDIGQKAKQEGWLVAEQIDAAAPDEQAYLVMCPHCARAHGIEPDHRRRDAVPTAVKQVCQVMARAEAGKQVA